MIAFLWVAFHRSSFAGHSQWPDLARCGNLEWSASPVIPGLPRNGVNQLWNIAMNAGDPDFTPRTISNTSYAGSQSPGDIEIVYTLSDYTNLGAFHFPTKVAYSMFNVTTTTYRRQRSRHGHGHSGVGQDSSANT